MFRAWLQAWGAGVSPLLVPMRVKAERKGLTLATCLPGWGAAAPERRG